MSYFEQPLSVVSVVLPEDCSHFRCLCLMLHLSTV
uniref:Uncharacterized protein n=1 Tax=Arundo donax TaxID=35708 RepID=A0A0A9C0K7_ARUDO